MKKFVFIISCLLMASFGWSNTEMHYEYPISNRYQAIFVGTPMMYMAPVPQEIKVKNLSLKVFK